MKTFKRNLFLILSCLILASPWVYSHRQSLYLQYFTFKESLKPSSEYHGSLTWLKTQKTSIIDSSNQPIVLRGVNVSSVNWSQYYNLFNPKAIRAAAKDWHVNVIRSRIYQSDFEKNPQLFFANLEQQILEPARENNLYVILHPWIGENASLPDSNTIAMWQAIAKRYKNDPTVLYDLLAEPRNISFQDLSLAYQKLIPTVRHYSPNSLIFVTGIDWGRDINIWVDQPLPFDNLVYRSNPYNRTGEFEGLFGKIAEKYPVLLGELGTSDNLSMSLEDVKNLLNYAQTLQIGWTAWNFSAEGCPCLLSDETTFTPTAYGALIRQYLLNPPPATYPAPVFNDSPLRFYLYSDFMENGFSDLSWGIDHQIQAKNPFSGFYAYRADFSPHGGIYLHSTRTISTKEYKNLHLDINLSNLNPFFLRLRSLDDQLSNPLSLSQFVTQIHGSWKQLTIPTSEINLPVFSSLMFEATDNLKKPITLYIDSIYLEK